jgi:hypothetical protein
MAWMTINKKKHVSFDPSTSGVLKNHGRMGLSRI